MIGQSAHPDDARLVDDVKKLLALPPYDTPSNICAHDGYFAHYLDQTYGVETVRRVSERLQAEHARGSHPGGPQPNPTPPQNGVAVARRELMDLAAWIESHFKLGARPAIADASPAEVIYAQVLRRLGDLQARKGS